MNTSTTTATQALPLDDISYWIATKDGKLEYTGPGHIIRIRGLRHVCTATFANGYRCACKLAYQPGELDICLLTDYEFTALIDRHLPSTIPTVEADEWRRGFILGWVITWESPSYNGEGEDE